MEENQKKADEAARAKAAQAFRYVRPDAARASAFQTLSISSEDIEAANRKRDETSEAAEARFPVPS